MPRTYELIVPSNTDRALGWLGAANLTHRGKKWGISWHHCGAAPVRVTCNGAGAQVGDLPASVCRTFRAAGEALGVYEPGKPPAPGNR